MGNEAIKHRPGTSFEAGVPHYVSDDPAVFDVCVMGLGYVGLPTAAVLASRGRRIAGVDVRSDVVRGVNLGEVHLVEPDLEVLVSEAVSSGRLEAFGRAVRADTYLICVPTPFDFRRRPDLTYVEAALDAILEVVRVGDLIVLESTVPPGTTRGLVAGRLLGHGLEPGKDVFIAHAPERVRPGDVVREVLETPRVVGGVTEACGERAAEFYRSLVDAPVHVTTSETAELTKLAENSYRDVNIAFANELANVCEHLGTDVWDVISLANEHPRVDILQPGVGAGGHCIAVDPWFLVAAAPHHTPLIRTARQVNDARVAHVVEQVQRAATRTDTPRIACLGLTYKADIDDLRNSPALAVVKSLEREHVGQLLLVEPHLDVTPLPGHPLVETRTALREANIVVILVGHRSFTSVPRSAFDDKLVVDVVGMLAG